jgi:flagella basal body P-ring formation protein FlgA
MSTRRTKIIRRRIVAGAVVVAAAVSAPVAVAATSSHSSKTAVHTQVMRDGTVQVSGYDGGVALAPSGR